MNQPSYSLKYVVKVKIDIARQESSLFESDSQGKRPLPRADPIVLLQAACEVATFIKGSNGIMDIICYCELDGGLLRVKKHAFSRAMVRIW